MKLTGPACTEALSEAEKAEPRERAKGNAGGVRVEREVRHPTKLKPTRAAEKPGWERTKGMPLNRRNLIERTSPKAKN